jgi:multidrug efflux pump subunit AcrA (membrane-fusion protein)
MATLKPRVNLALSRESYEIITRLARLRGTGRASIVTELVEAVVPQLAQTADLIEAAQKSKPKTLEALRARVNEAYTNVMDSSDNVTTEMDLLVGDIVKPKTKKAKK